MLNSWYSKDLSQPLPSGNPVMEKDPVWNERLTNTTYMEDEVRKTEEWMRTIVLGEMSYWARKGTKVILLEAEPISPEVYPLDTKKG